MPTIELNYWAILVATAAAMVIGTIWYARPVFGRTWMSLVNLTPEKAKKGAALGLLGMLVFAFVQAYILAHFITIAIGSPFFTTTTDLMQGIYTAFWGWLGFVVPVLIAGPLFARTSWKLFFIGAGNQFVTLIAMGAILGAWR
ncbi:MAG: DUF1761 domain-containing protein [Candidatus Andersenbacteria bacterium]